MKRWVLILLIPFILGFTPPSDVLPGAVGVPNAPTWIGESMAFPTTGILDDFNRANTGPPPSANWSSMYAGMTGQFEVTSNQCTVDSLGDFLIGAGNSWNVSTYTSNIEAYVTLVAKPGTTATSFALLVRTANPNTTTPDSYAIVVETLASTDQIRLIRTDDGVNTTLDTYDVEVSNGDSVGISIVGSTLEGYYKAGAGAWTKVLDATDSTYSAAGSICIVSTSTAVILDNFGGGTPSASASKTGALTSSGQSRRSSAVVARAKAGAASFAGGYKRSLGIQRTKAGVLSTSGSLSRIVTAVRANSGVLSISGTTSGTVVIPKYGNGAGAFSPAGSLSRTVAANRLDYGSVPISGSLIRAIELYRSKSGALSLSGDYARLLNSSRNYASAVSFAGAVSGVLASTSASSNVSGAISYAGAVSRLLEASRIYSGSLGLFASVTRASELSRSKSGGLSFSGEVSTGGSSAYLTSGALSFTGLSSRRSVLSRPKSGVLSLSGAVTRHLQAYRTYSSSLGFTGEVPEAYKEMMFYGVRN